MKVFRTLTLAIVAVTFAVGTAFAQTTPPPAKPATKPATAPATKTPAAPAVKATTVALKDIPTAVKDAVTKAYPKGTITKATSTGTGADIVYTVSVKNGTKTATYKCTADGKVKK
jgi:hypothetical protein